MTLLSPEIWPLDVQLVDRVLSIRCQHSCLGTYTLKELTRARPPTSGGGVRALAARFQAGSTVGSMRHSLKENVNTPVMLGVVSPVRSELVYARPAAGRDQPSAKLLGCQQLTTAPAENGGVMVVSCLYAAISINLAVLDWQKHHVL